ncbi:MAG: uroporphyrinogen decarboxylase family protein [Candidatus Bipolaricaulota bacterium]
MIPKDRLLTALNHQEPDRVPQHGLPFGTLEVVRKDVKDKIEAFAPGGGYVFSTIHNIQPEVPPENVMAMLETLREFGAY